MLDVAAVVHGTGARVIRIGPDGVLAENSLATSDLVRDLYAACIDSRSVAPGSLFVALPGERVDGHEYVDAAFAAGARGALVSRVPELRERGYGDARYLFTVPDSLAGLQSLAAFWRRRMPAQIIGVTGSVGKTTAKDILAGVLGAKWPVLASEANLNTEIGMPLMILRIDEQHRAAVLEMGMHEPGDIRLLARLAQPKIGVVTNVAPVHLERMGTLEAIAREKSMLIQALPPDGLAVLNADDPWTRDMARVSGVAPALLAGLAADADLNASAIQAHGLDGVSFMVRAEGCTRRFRTQIAGTHTVPAVLMAIAVGRHLGMTWEELEAAVEGVRLESRQRLHRLRGGVLLIDDRYNASPLSMHAALQLLESSNGIRIAVLGDMLELGPTEHTDHCKIGREVAKVADRLIVRGERAAWIADGAEDAGMSPDRIIRVSTNDDAADATLSLLAQLTSTGASPTMQRRGDAVCTVLVKGSRGMRMEEIVTRLLDEAG